MTHRRSWFRMGLAAVALCAASIAWSAPASAQTFNGQAAAVQATVLGSSGSLGDTGLLNVADDARESSLGVGSLSSLVSGETIHATTITWPDQADSEASLGSLGMSIAGNGISADFVFAQASAVLGSAGTGQSQVYGLVVNGVPLSVGGAPNQVVPLYGGRLIVNEQSLTSSGAVVNALHVVIDGVADVVIGSAKAGSWSGSSGGGLGNVLGGLL